jgi:hypothetical protein
MEGQIKKILKKHALNKIALVVSAVLFVWSIWQHEIMMFPYIQQQWNSTFQFFSGVKVHWGTAYDYTLLLEFIAYIMLGMALWFW